MNSLLSSSMACSSITLLRLWLPKSTAPGSWPDNGTRRRVITACFRLLMCLTSASVDTSPASEKHGPSLAAPGKEKQIRWSLICQNRAHWCYKLDGISMGAPVETPAASSPGVERPTTNLVPELHGTPHSVSSGRLTVSPEEWNTKLRSPMMCLGALNTSLWRLWKATILLLQMKANGMWRMRTNAMANQEYRPHPRLQFLTTDLHVAECPQVRTVQIHLQSHFPNYPWCPQRYLLHWLVRFNYHLLWLPPTLSSRTPLPPWWPHPNRGQIAKWGLHCSQEHPRQWPVLARHWLHSHQRGMLSRPLPQLYSLFSSRNDVANELLHGGFTYLFIKFLIISFKVWLICLPAMTSACILKDTLRNDTQVFLKFRDSIFEVCLHLINSKFTPYFLPSSMLSSDSGTSNEIPHHESGLSLPAIPINFSFSFF